MEAHNEGTWLNQVSMAVLTLVLAHEGKPTPQERGVTIELDRALLEQAEDMVGKLAAAVRER